MPGDVTVRLCDRQAPCPTGSVTDRLRAQQPGRSSSRAAAATGPQQQPEPIIGKLGTLYSYAKLVK